jgi:2,3,4,5-tetrahydropyridine-2-carboxylate N-succinyltransferase
MPDRTCTMRGKIEELFLREGSPRTPAVLDLLEEFRIGLESAEFRAAEKDATGAWTACPWVKKGIILLARLGKLTEAPAGVFDFDTLAPRQFRPAHQVRIPGGSSVFRGGCYIAPGATCMPPVTVNAGVYIGSGSLVDSHSMIGVCAQIGDHVQIGPATQIAGSVLPVDQLPVIIEDRVMILGQCGIYGSVHIGAGAVVGPGVILNHSMPVYDLKRDRVVRASKGEPLEIPPAAVLMPAARQVTHASALGVPMMLGVPVIIGYRGESENDAELLDHWLA